jgi:hypothetical protein
MVIVLCLWLQAEDIDLIIEREEEQIKQLTKAYREELTQIEVCITHNLLRLPGMVCGYNIP